MARPRVLVLGGGFGGLSAAHTLRREAGEQVDLLVVDSGPTFLMGLRKLWILDGRSSPGEGERSRASLRDAGIPFRQGTVEGVEVEGRRVRVDGEDFGYDYLVLALGAQPRPDLVPGSSDGNPNLYAAEGAREAASRLRELERGLVLIAIAGVPYKCPPAPYEAAFLIDALLRRMDRRGDVQVDVLTPQPMSLPVAGPAACAVVEGRLAGQGIGFRPKTRIASMEPGRVVTDGGEALEADLVLLVPPHRPPSVVEETGLTGDGEWVQVDPGTLATQADGVFAIGDAVELTTGGGMPFPKAGVFAERQGEVVARNIAAAVSGNEPAEAFEGSGHCFLEVGDGAATLVSGNFMASPPQVTIAEPSPEYLEAKVAFERERLERWFPAR